MANEDKTAKADRSEQLRETSKWLMTIFGAVGGVLISGLQLTGLGKTSGMWLIIALLGFALAIGGVGWIIWQLTQVFSAGVLNRTVLERFYSKASIGGVVVDDTSFLRGKYSSLAEFVKALDRHQGTWWTLNDADRRSPDQQNDAGYFSLVQNEIQKFASQGLVSEQFRKSIGSAFLGFIVSAIGIVLFAIAVGQNVPISPTSSNNLKPQILTFTSEKQGNYVANFGKQCLESPISVYVLGSKPDQVDVLSIPSDTCKAVRMTIPNTDIVLTEVSK